MTDRIHAGDDRDDPDLADVTSDSDTGEHVATAPHEIHATLWYPGTLAPYWALSGAMLGAPFEGSNEFDVQLPTKPDGRLENWTFDVYYSQGKIDPLDRFGIENSRGMYEWRLVGRGEGERKASFHIRPRFAGMKHVDSGESIDTPWQGFWPELDDLDDQDTEGVDVVAQGSNVEPDRYPYILHGIVDHVISQAGNHWNDSYLKPSQINGNHSKISVYERYVRLTRTFAKKLTHKGSYFWRLMYHLAGEQGAEMEFRVDNSEIIGYNHRMLLTKSAARKLPGQRFGKQLKVYQPQHVRKSEDGDPLYHPKFGALFKKGKNDESSIKLNTSGVAWKDREDLTRELEGTIINTLEHSGVPTDNSIAFVPDDHFQATTTDDPVQLVEDVTPELEAEQEAIIVKTFRDLTDADLDILDQLAGDGGEAHYEDIADDTGRSVSTIYRAIERMNEIVESNNGYVRAKSQKLLDDLGEILSVTKQQQEATIKAASQLLDLDERVIGRLSASMKKWLAKYAAELEADDDGRIRLKIESIMSRLRYGDHPHIGEVLTDGLTAWAATGNDAVEFRNGVVEYRTPGGSIEKGKIGAILNDWDNRNRRRTTH